MISQTMAARREYSIEDGFRVNNLERRRARSRCFFASVVFVVAGCIGSIVLSEMFRYETSRALHQIADTMQSRESICLSSLHVGRTDYRMILLAEMHNETSLALLNPSIFQSFGKTIKTQELAHPPTQCYTTRKKAYSIHRERRESVSVTFTTVNASNPLWPAKTLIPTLIKQTMTFNGLRSYCIQHMMELFALKNACDELTDGQVSYDRRIEL
jgi:hypothetical protein